MLRSFRKHTLLLAIVIACGRITDAFASDNLGPANYPDSLTMTCAEAQAYIAKNDGAILATGGARASFHSSYCSGQPAYVRTKDVLYCYVGEYCDCATTYCTQSFFQGQ